MNFSASSFFNLTEFSHKGIFHNDDHVWNAIRRINEFIDQELEVRNKKNVFMDPSSIIQDTARIEGKAIIGKNCIIGHGVLLRDGVIIGDNVSIGHGGEIKHSVVLNGTSIGHLNYVGDSIIGNSVNISGGAILANLRLDKEKVKVKYEDELLETDLEKFGAVVGDGSTVGVNAVLNPGTILNKGCIVYPLTSVKGTHPENSIIKER